MAGGPTYSREEMDAILKRALERQAKDADGIAHEDLVAAAVEVGIPREEVEAAAQEVAASKHARADFAIDQSSRRHAVRTWFTGAASWAVMSVFFYFLCFTLHQNWWIWPVAGWGLGIALSGVRLFIGGEHTGTDDGRRVTRHERRQAKRDARHDRRRQHREDKIKDFEQRVAVGAEALFRILDQVKVARDRVDGEKKAARVRVDGSPGVVEAEAAESEQPERRRKSSQ